jgi:hypothetical protein
LNKLFGSALLLIFSFLPSHIGSSLAHADHVIPFDFSLLLPFSQELPEPLFASAWAILSCFSIAIYWHTILLQQSLLEKRIGLYLTSPY